MRDISTDNIQILNAIHARRLSTANLHVSIFSMRAFAEWRQTFVLFLDHRNREIPSSWSAKLPAREIEIPILGSIFKSLFLDFYAYISSPNV